MNLSFAKSSAGNNTGSCTTLVEYLNKENENKLPEESRFFFSHDQDEVLNYTVEDEIDSNHRKLGKNDAKFYMLTINPSQKELQHINCNEKDLMAYTREVMEAYASNFNKGLNSKDLVWFAKIEEFRTDKKTKEKKSGPNWHVHVIVSRRDKEQRYKLSPLSNHRNTGIGPVTGGFERNNLREKSEKIFDEMFSYKRDFKDGWLYQNTVKNGTVEERDQMIIYAEKLEKGLLQKIGEFLQGIHAQKEGHIDMDEIQRKNRRKKKKGKDIEESQSR